MIKIEVQQYNTCGKCGNVNEIVNQCGCDKNNILKYLPEGDKAMFLSDLLEAIALSKKQGTFSAIDECLNTWEATAEMAGHDPAHGEREEHEGNLGGITFGTHGTYDR